LNCQLIGNDRAEPLAKLIALIEEHCGKKAIRMEQPTQAGDVPATYAELSAIQCDLGCRPTTPIDVRIPLWSEWCCGYRAVNATQAFADG
jgi:UDP-glucuronate 4-epimerase